MDANKLSQYIRDELLPQRQSPYQSIIIETVKPEVSRFDRRKAKEIHKFAKVFERNRGLYLAKRTNAKTGFHLSDCFNYGVEFKGAYWEEPKKKTGMTYQDVLNRRYDEFTWSNLTLESIGRDVFPGRPKVRYITGLFTPEQMNEIEEAFKLKKNIHIEKPGERRDLSVSTNWNAEHNLFTANFSSEYAGTGNGDYYLLLNPTFAVFYESD